MTALNQSLRQASIRAVTGKTLFYNGDWHALWDSLSTPGVFFDERMLNYINTKLSPAVYSNVNDAMQAFAVNQGYNSWNSMGTFTP